MKYMKQVDNRIKEYFYILEPEFPEWMNKYIDTKELLKQQYISVTCGTIYSDLFENDFFFSSLDHSIAVALIIWHFTHDKKQTLSGLFHDIATPVFKHSIDFMNNDYMKQESTEDSTKYIIENSKEIMNLLKKDNISLEEICDYHMYSIADNDTPQLSSDRLEYSLSNALFTYKLCDIKDIKNIYSNIYISNDENNNEELAFKSLNIALLFVKITSRLSVIYREDRTRYSMQLLADIIKKLIKEEIIKIEDLYILKEKDIINIIEKSRYNEVFQIWKNSKEVKISKKKPSNVYYVHHGAKIRYIDPLVKNKRLSKINIAANKMFKKNLNYDMSNYVYLDFNI